MGAYREGWLSDLLGLPVLWAAEEREQASLFRGAPATARCLPLPTVWLYKLSQASFPTEQLWSEQIFRLLQCIPRIPFPASGVCVPRLVNTPVWWCLWEWKGAGGRFPTRALEHVLVLSPSALAQTCYPFLLRSGSSLCPPSCTHFPLWSLYH